ncbi:MAG TPA: hypothetical protein VJ625_09680 [Propionibacteriaceae bacterium]|nr:hypothetical protein [Propionibacteriaceae bacterium]
MTPEVSRYPVGELAAGHDDSGTASRDPVMRNPNLVDLSAARFFALAATNDYGRAQEQL